MDSGRRRGKSFHEEDDEDEHSNSSCSNSNDMQFITSQFIGSASCVSGSLASSQVSFNHQDKHDSGKSLSNDGSDEIDVDDDDVYNRGRSRSRSVHQADGSIPVIPNDINSATTNNNNSNTNTNNSSTLTGNSNVSSINSNNVDNQKNDKVERSGPLKQTEIYALKKGLEEATLHRNREQIKEEEEEKKAAESEKKLRSVITAPASSLSTDNATTLKRIKILMLGDSGVGKSSLIMRWTADTFNPSLVGTVGVNFKTKKISIEDEFLQVQVWDTAGQEQFHKITTSYYKGANGIILVYDVSDKKSMENVEYWVKNIKSHASENVQVALVGSKSDLRALDNNSGCIDSDASKAIASIYGVPCFETSAKDSTNVDDAFMTVVNNILASDPSLGKSKPAGLSKRSLSKLDKPSDKSGVFTSLGNVKLSIFTNANSTPNNNIGNSGTSINATNNKEKCTIS